MPDRRTLVTCAALGLLAGALLVAVLTLLAGARIIVGLGWVWRYDRFFDPYRLIDPGGSHPALLPLLPVALGAGVLAGLLVAFGVRFVPGPRAAVWPVAGVAVGLLLAVGVHLWRWNAPVGGETIVYHGRYVALDQITPSRAYSSTLEIGTRSSWWPLVMAGAVVGVVAAVLGLLVARRVSGSTSPSG